MKSAHTSALLFLSFGFVISILRLRCNVHGSHNDSR